uniref:PSI domain-containing protein n=1 Tax=Anopheles farauti TaxID=69004 RepID=A0A182Q8E6_9DIPT
MMAAATRVHAPLHRSLICITILTLLSVCQYSDCVKVPRKYLETDLAASGSSFPVSTVVPAPNRGNDTVTTPEGGATSSYRSVVPLDESKKSLSKLKLQQENLNGKKQQLQSGLLGDEASHLLGFNGTGQRRDFGNTNDNTNKSTLGNPIKLVGTSGLTAAQAGTNAAPNVDSATTQQPSTNGNNLPQDTRDPISDAINIDTIERTEAELNSTLQQHNITKTHEDNHMYYKSTWSTDKSMSNEFWKKITTNLTVNTLLSNSHRRATTILLSFDFPFYGFPIRNITIASGGFLYTGDYVHSWLASTQYIAPLMANFDTALSNDSLVKYRDDGENFTVVWENVILQDRPNNGSFTFSVTLNKSGDIVFAYKKIPINIQQIFENPLMKNHPVKIGLSDAYIIDKTIMRTKQKTIYEYHRVNFGQTEVQNDTIITLTALPTCFSFKDCESCITHEEADFECLWCPTINRCSTGTDRKRQDWINKGCDATTISAISYCPALGQKGNSFGVPVEVTTKMMDKYNSSKANRDNLQPLPDGKPSLNPNGSGAQNGSTKDESINKAAVYHATDVPSESSSNLIVSMVVVLGLLITCGCWVLYAYRNPHTKSGQLLIRYRPNKWLWRRGEARYTAASIHM